MSKNSFSIKALSTLCLLNFVLTFFPCCGLHQSKKKLTAESKKFLEAVRYLIMDDEYKIFMNLPISEREKFIEEFWSRRDSFPDTEENEFKNAYLNRIKNANKLFGVGQAGFYSDRGMIYVLFGPPDDIHKSQIFTRREGSDQEIWLYSRLIDKYSNVRLNFIDRFGTDNYELVKDSRIYSILQYVKLYYINLAKKKDAFPYDLKIIRTREKGNKADLLIQIEVPYKNIWFTSTDNKMKTILSLKIDIFNASNNKIWEFEEDYFISFKEEEATEFFDQKHLIEIPVTLEKGNYLLNSNLAIQSGKKGRVTRKFRI